MGYEYAKQKFAELGIDTEEVLKVLSDITISMHCWQGDDVGGFDTDGELTGGIQATGNYPGKARTPKQLMQDADFAFSLIGGKKKFNLHASYAIFENGEYADRDAIKPSHFQKWVDFAKERNMGLDFNPTLFSHPMAGSLTLSSPCEETRRFWIEHCKRCVEIAQYFADETGYPCVLNIWIPDGFKDVPADRLGPRKRFAESLDEILKTPHDKEKVLISLESKVFGIGLESYTAGSSEFGLLYAMKNGILPMMDNGHYHPTEEVYDKISSLLVFFDKIALHITRSVRWDSDHVVKLDDQTREIAKEIIASGRLNDIVIALDYFDASINRIAAWVAGMRNVRYALLEALLTPHEYLKKLQDEENFTKLFVMQDEFKKMSVKAVWDEFCRRENVPSDNWYDCVEKYEKEVLSKRV